MKLLNIIPFYGIFCALLLLMFACGWITGHFSNRAAAFRSAAERNQAMTLAIKQQGMSLRSLEDMGQCLELLHTPAKRRR